MLSYGLALLVEVKGTRSRSLPVFESNFWTALLRANQMPTSGPIEKLPSPGVLSASSPAISGVMVNVSGRGIEPHQIVRPVLRGPDDVVLVHLDAVGAGKHAGGVAGT